MMGRPDQDQKLAKVKDFMALVGSHAQAARDHANASSRMHGAASKHVYMDKHTVYAVEPHVNTLLYTDGLTIMRSGFPDAVQHQPTANTRRLYGDNYINNQANGSLAFAAARHSDWSNTGAGRQPYPFFSGSQEQMSVQKVNNYQATHARANENAMMGCVGTALNCDVPANFSQNHPRGLKVFPFLAPVLQHEHSSAVRAQEAPTPIGRAVIPPFGPVTEGSSSRIMPPDSSIRPSTPQLTIFYAGQINVYNDVSPTQAQDIILKAAAYDHLQADKGNKLDGLTAEARDHLLQPNKGTLDAEKSIPLVMSNEQGPLLHAALPDLLRLDLSTGQSGQSTRVDPVDIDHSPASAQEAPQTVEVGAQSAYHDDEPAVPKALPQARKASLARFLEKRRERMLSKAPYFVETCFL